MGQQESSRPTGALPLTEAIRLRLTGAERRAFDRLALRLATSRSRLLRRAVREMVRRGPDLFADELVAISETTRELAAVGRNLNQVAARLNSGEFAYPSDIVNLVREMSGTVTKLQADYRSLVRAARLRWVSVLKPRAD